MDWLTIHHYGFKQVQLFDCTWFHWPLDVPENPNVLPILLSEIQLLPILHLSSSSKNKFSTPGLRPKIRSVLKDNSSTKIRIIVCGTGTCWDGGNGGTLKSLFHGWTAGHSHLEVSQSPKSCGYPEIIQPSWNMLKLPWCHGLLIHDFTETRRIAAEFSPHGGAAPGSCRLVKATKPWYWGFSSILFCRNSTSALNAPGPTSLKTLKMSMSEVSRSAATFGMLKGNRTGYCINLND